ncbi:MAG: hypothetical protein U1F43_01370 [Myxococcota bacterium]
MLAPARADAPRRTPTLDARSPIFCVDDPDGVPRRLQCDTPATGPGVCWVAPACVEAKPRGGDACTPFERVRYCEYAEDRTYAALTADHRLVAARPDVEQGYWRDDEGRVFQVQFDLNQRFWLGARWLGTWGDGGDGGAARKDTDGVGLEMGLRADILDSDLKHKTRFYMLETDLTLSPFTLKANFMHLDSSNDGDDPFLRVTTFVGTPARHDVYVTAGSWGELLTLEHRARASADDSFVRVVGGGLTWDLWHDADMTSYFRVRAGLALDDILRRGEDAVLAVTPLAYLEGDFTFDDAGFHHLKLSSGYEALFFDAGHSEIDSFRRFQSELAYELVLIALNDQPITLRAAVSGGYRDDLVDPTRNGWEVTATAGLRFSLWAPARDLDARDRAEQRLRERGQ